VLSQNSRPLASAETEMAYLGSLIFDPAMITETAGSLKRGMFSIQAHGLIFDAMVGLHTKGTPVDVVTLRDDLARLGTLKAVGGADYIIALVDGVPNASNAPAYADTIRDLYTRRLLLHMLSEMEKEIASSPDAIDVMATINRAIVAVGEAQGSGAFEYLSDLIGEAINHQPDLTSPVVTRIGKVDGNINLFAPGEMTIVAARPSIGKSSLMRQMAINASTAGVALIFSLEVTPQVLGLQMTCELAEVPYSDYARRVANEEQIQRVVIAAGDPRLKNIAAFNKTNVSALDVSLAITQVRAMGKPIAAVFIDYLGLMRHDRAERNDLAVGATTRLLKQVALERKVPIILLSQLNREVEKRGGGTECDRPRLADLRDSGNIEQDADNVLFLWRRERDDTYKVVEPRTLTVAKHRNGQVFEVDLMFDKAKGRFFEVNDRGQAPPVPEWYSGKK
jgi:replicative DNA helicase